MPWCIVTYVPTLTINQKQRAWNNSTPWIPRLLNNFPSLQGGEKKSLFVRGWITAKQEVLLLHRTHFVFRDWQLGWWVTVGGRIVRLLGCSSWHMDVGCNSRHLSSLTLCRYSRAIWRLVHVAVWNVPHTSEMLEQAFSELVNCFDLKKNRKKVKRETTK